MMAADPTRRVLVVVGGAVSAHPTSHTLSALGVNHTDDGKCVRLPKRMGSFDPVTVHPVVQMRHRWSGGTCY